MHYIKLPWLDGPVSIFDICQAHQQLESDYNKGGWVHERPSNQRRMESTSCQLSRMQYSDVHRWVDICSDNDGLDTSDDDAVRDIYLMNVLQWGLPMDDEMRAFVGARYTAKFLDTFPNWRTQ